MFESGAPGGEGLAGGEGEDDEDGGVRGRLPAIRSVQLLTCILHNFILTWAHTKHLAKNTDKNIGCVHIHLNNVGTKT